MPENNFEDEVQRTLGGLKIHPAASVWTVLEKELRERKRKRFALFFFLLAGILLTGSTAYFFLANHKTKQQAAAATNKLPQSDDLESNSAKKSNGEKSGRQAQSTDGQSSNGQQFNGEQSNEQPSKGQQSNGQQSNGQQSNGQQSNGQQSNGQQSNSEQPASGKLSGHPLPDKNTGKGSTAIPAHSKAITGFSTPATRTRDKMSESSRPATTARDNKTRQPAPSGRQVEIQTKRVPALTGRQGSNDRNEIVMTKPPEAAEQKQGRSREEEASDSSANPANAPARNSNTNPAKAPAQTAGLSPLPTTNGSNKDDVASDRDAAKQATDPVSSETIASQNKISLADTAASAAPVMAVKKKPFFSIPKRQWVFGFSAGASVTGKLPGRSTTSDPGTQSYFSPSNGPGLPGVTAAVIPPSQSHPAFAFEISGGLQQRISAASSLFAGLAYSYSGNRIRVGDYRTLATTGATTSPAFNVGVQAYTGSPHHSFFNRYHILSIPIRYQLLLNPASRMPLQWHLSAAPGYLFSSDAVVYTTALGGSYYRDRNAYNRFRMSVGTGFDVMLKQRQGWRWSIGPEVNMSLNKLMNNIEDKQQHVYYGGLSGKFYFGR